MTLIEGAPPPTDPVNWGAPLIVVPYCEGMLHRETVDSVRAGSYPYVLWQVDRADPYAYGALLAEQWNRGQDLVVVEQDIIVPDGAIDMMVSCTAPWCSHLYYTGTEVPSYGLGLCKFSVAVQSYWPTLAEQAARSYTGKARSMRYEALNERYISLMNHWGYKVHLHEPAALHLHEYGNTNG